MHSFIKKTGLGFLVGGFLLSPLPAQAQNYGTYYGVAPMVPYYGLCWSGCTQAEKIVNYIGAGMEAVNYGFDLHDSLKAQSRALEEHQYQSEAMKSAPYNPQRMQDFYNIQKVSPFFDDIPSTPATPKVGSIIKKSPSEK